MNLDPRFSDPATLDRLAGMVTNRVGRVRSRPIDPDALLVRDIALMITTDGRTELINVEQVTRFNIGGRTVWGGYFTEYQKRADREWELVYRPGHHPSVAPSPVPEWQHAALEADGYLS